MMKCEKIAEVLETTLLRDRDPAWMLAARQHAEQCPACAKLLKLHQVEESLTGLTVAEPSPAFLETVMQRAMQQKPMAVPAPCWSVGELLRYASVCVGALLLIVISYWPNASDTWQTRFDAWAASFCSFHLDLSLSKNPFVILNVFQRFSELPDWAVGLASIAFVLLVLGILMPRTENNETQMDADKRRCV
jgi:hypothetical protein